MTGEVFISYHEVRGARPRLKSDTAMAFLAAEKGVPMTVEGVSVPRLHKDYHYQMEKFIDGVIIRWKPLNKK